ncbi:VCBS repeat-containing protein [Spirosoma soli]|uniref:VCBS repeat-containing protein n=1 Tax=Spirosoma soli TaxID=1770529 RepID=A0ABW5M2P8_9BACT
MSTYFSKSKQSNWPFLLGPAALLCFGLLLTSCQSRRSTAGLGFTQLPASQTNITFNNQLTESDSVNFYNNEYMYIGAGVGVGDFNNDGLQDVFFAGSQVSSKLYINKGTNESTSFQFEDISDKAGIQTRVWCTGVSVIDINADGFQDIYVCVSHSADPQKRKNLLFINQHNLTFTEEAEQYGLADTGYSTQAAFLDYDQDGDLDMYLLNHQLYNPQPNKLVPKDTTGTSPAADKLYRNDGPVSLASASRGQEIGAKVHFTDVSLPAGIREDGYGLGVVVTDANQDGLPDLYVANDYISNDVLWLNTGNGKFVNCLTRAAKHQSYNSMGVDAADINNDLLPDLAVLDMSPPTNERKKLMFTGVSPEKFDVQQRLGYEPEYSRNMLQLNQGIRQNGLMAEPIFSEIGQLAGMSETDWSWSVLMADFDNDGWKDMHVTNGLARDLTNSDFVMFRQETSQPDYQFAGATSNPLADAATIRNLREKLDTYGSVEPSNVFMRNNRNLTFSDETNAVGLETPSVSHGAAYADFDNDGDLDLVVNNMNREAFVYRNDLRQTKADTTNNFLSISLAGERANLSGIGAKVIIYTGNETQLLEQSLVRGYLSTIDTRLHIGLGNRRRADSLRIIWPNGRTQLLKNVTVNQFLTLRLSDSQEADNRQLVTTSPSLFKAATLDFRHQETPFFDYYQRRLQPQKYSQLGPCLATGDVNGDGLTDFFVGGAARQPGKLFIQNAAGTFTGTDVLAGAKDEEDLAAELFDADGDHDLDLFVAGGSTEYRGNLMLPPKLFLNDGKGSFTISPNAVPATVQSLVATLATADYDHDGDQDVFVGGRVSADRFPASPKSYLLQNNNGVFQDVTARVCPPLTEAGMVTDAVWTDIDGDQQADLVVCGEWMPVRFFKNNRGKLTEVTDKTGLTNMHGLWRSLAVADLDGDGDKDLVAGNLGHNNKYHISAKRPHILYAKDIDKNGSYELIPAYYIKNQTGAFSLFPDLDRTQFAEQTPIIKKKYLLHSDYARVDMATLLNDIGTDDLLELRCTNASTVWLESKGKGQFAMHVLPTEAQFAPVNAIIADDLDGDGKTDLLLAGNEYQTEVSTGRYDASLGLFLRGNGKGNVQPVPYRNGGVLLEGDVKALGIVPDAMHRKIILAGVNNSLLHRFTVNLTSTVVSSKTHQTSLITKK